jgi:RNA-directed DNA polymerase
MEALRRLALEGTEWARVQVDTIRLKLFKIGAIVKISVHRILLQLSSTRFADDMVILIDAERRSDWLVKAIVKRQREQFAKLRVAINEDKSRMVDLKKGERFTFPGCEYRRILGFRQKGRPYYAPKLKKRTAPYEKLREVFRQHVSWPIEVVIAKINPILRGWVNYFRIGHSSSCFSKVKQWVEMEVRKHLIRARGRNGCKRVV